MGPRRGCQSKSFNPQSTLHAQLGLRKSSLFYFMTTAPTWLSCAMTFHLRVSGPYLFTQQEFAENCVRANNALVNKVFEIPAAFGLPVQPTVNNSCDGVSPGDGQDSRGTELGPNYCLAESRCWDCLRSRAGLLSAHLSTSLSLHPCLDAPARETCVLLPPPLRENPSQVPEGDRRGWADTSPSAHVLLLCLGSHPDFQDQKGFGGEMILKVGLHSLASIH